MDIVVSATDARRKFATLLRGVVEGRSYLITFRGKPVARMTPATAP
jgi:prevent-host-death family protein